MIKMPMLKKGLLAAGAAVLALGSAAALTPAAASAHDFGWRHSDRYQARGYGYDGYARGDSGWGRPGGERWGRYDHRDYGWRGYDHRHHEHRGYEHRGYDWRGD